MARLTDGDAVAIDIGLARRNRDLLVIAQQAGHRIDFRDGEMAVILAEQQFSCRQRNS